MREKLHPDPSKPKRTKKQRSDRPLMLVAFLFFGGIAWYLWKQSQEGVFLLPVVLFFAAFALAGLGAFIWYPAAKRFDARMAARAARPESRRRKLIVTVILLAFLGGLAGLGIRSALVPHRVDAKDLVEQAGVLAKPLEFERYGKRGGRSRLTFHLRAYPEITFKVSVPDYVHRHTDAELLRAGDSVRFMVLRTDAERVLMHDAAASESHRVGVYSLASGEKEFFSRNTYNRIKKQSSWWGIVWAVIMVVTGLSFVQRQWRPELYRFCQARGWDYWSTFFKPRDKD